jgi:biopolymer transport protein ExbB
MPILFYLSQQSTRSFSLKCVFGLTVLFSFLMGVGASVHADELEQAYQKEFAYLVAEKQALEKRLLGLNDSQSSTLKGVDQKIDVLQKQYLSKKNKVDRLNQLIVDASRDVDFSENDQLLLETTLIQARMTLKKSALTVDETLVFDQQLQQLLISANSLLKADGVLTKKAETFYELDGKASKAQVLNVGRIAKYGFNDERAGVLAPSGNGKFKVWDATSQASAQALVSGQNPENISVFLFDNAELSIEKQAEKGITDDVKAGGLIGKIILVIGLVGLVLIIVRIIFLLMLGADIQKITVKVNTLIEKDGVNAALKACKKNVSSASRVISATLRNIKKERGHIEDIISESILYESSKIDRFGSAILVIAAVSPLLGLLGTVTGMIGTFDIITEFGTGDPKLLSTGISEALVTTKFGLVVAIPLLLVGNLLSSWGLRTKNGLERAALNVINTHKASLPADA